MTNGVENCLLILADLLAEAYHLVPGVTMNLEAQIGERVIQVEITLKEGE